MTGQDWPKVTRQGAAALDPIGHEQAEVQRLGALEARVTALEDVLYRNGLSKHAVPLSEAEKATTRANLAYEARLAEEELFAAKLRIEHLEKANATLLRMVSQSEKDNLRRVLGEDI